MTFSLANKFYCVCFSDLFCLSRGNGFYRSIRKNLNATRFDYQLRKSSSNLFACDKRFELKSKLKAIIYEHTSVASMQIQWMALNFKCAKVSLKILHPQCAAFDIGGGKNSWPLKASRKYFTSIAWKQHTSRLNHGSSCCQGNHIYIRLANAHPWYCVGRVFYAQSDKATWKGKRGVNSVGLILERNLRKVLFKLIFFLIVLDSNET